MLEPLTNNVMITLLLALLAAAVITDIRHRRIPNRLVVIGLIVGLAGHGLMDGWGGLAVASLGALAGLACLLPFYVSGGMGAGDVKLMAMCGAFLGPFHVVTAALATLVVGGLLGAGLLALQFGAEDEGNSDGRRVEADSPGHRSALASVSAIPYALAICTGALISLKAGPAVLLALG